ncbi:hypothetical protein XENOCAPTIV_017558, partial [Xenoophorus captivus]
LIQMGQIQASLVRAVRSDPKTCHCDKQVLLQSFPVAFLWFCRCWTAVQLTCLHMQCAGVVMARCELVVSGELVQKGETKKETETYLDLFTTKNIKLKERVLIPVKQYPKEELRKGGEPKFAHLSMELHVFIEVFAPVPDAYLRMAHAMEEVKKFLFPVFRVFDSLFSLILSVSVQPYVHRGCGKGDASSRCCCQRRCDSRRPSQRWSNEGCPHRQRRTSCCTRKRGCGTTRQTPSWRTTSKDGATPCSPAHSRCSCRELR